MLTKELMEYKSRKVQETGNEALKLLNLHKKCLIIRPTGFGKSYLLAHISTMFDYTCYVYPRDIIKSEVQTKYKNILDSEKIEFLSYQGIAAYYKKNGTTKGLIPKVDGKGLIVLDEVHFCMATQWSVAIMDLLCNYNQMYLLGATATPNRPDNREFRYSLFDGVEVSKYTLTDAINDGIYHNPLYVFSVHEVERFIRDRKSSIVNDKFVSETKRCEVLNTIDKFVLEHGIFEDSADIIRKYCKQEFPDLNYFKFMVFFPSYEIMYAKMSDVSKWLEKAFPGYSINEIIVDRNHRKNIKSIQKLVEVPNQVDVIYSIDMLSYGVHIDGINCILMLRNTCSDIIYAQQIGRALSIDNERPSIIFDFVGNLNRRQYYGGYKVLSNSKNHREASEWQDFSQVIRSVDNIADLRELDRISDLEYLKEERMWVDAVLHKHCPVELAMERLGILTKEDMDRVIARYR